VHVTMHEARVELTNSRHDDGWLGDYAPSCVHKNLRTESLPKSKRQAQEERVMVRASERVLQEPRRAISPRAEKYGSKPLALMARIQVSAHH
jgi:hypothetical protein